jgi:hypothetical protein
MRRSVSLVATIALTPILVGLPADSQTPVRVGVEGQINTYTTNSQGVPDVGVDGNGNLVIVWVSDGSWGSDNSDYSIQGRIFFSNGLPAGPEDQVNTRTDSRQNTPAVAVDSDSGFVVVWGDSSDGSGGGIRGQRYGSNGLPAGAEFLVNSCTTEWQTRPSVAIDAEGDFVVVWDSDESDGDDSWENSIQGRLFSSNGDPTGPDFQVNSYTTGLQSDPEVGMNADGDFVVVWTSVGSEGSDPTGASIQGRIFSSSGAPITPQVQINTYTTSAQIGPAVAVNGEGSFVVVWTSYGSNGDDDDGSASIQGRVFASNGAPIGVQAQVNTYTTSLQESPAVAIDQDGNFVVTWTSWGSVGDDDQGTSVQGQLYASNLLPVGSQFQINTYTTGHQGGSAVEFDTAGRFVVVWHSYGSSGNDSSYRSIQGQRFAIPLVFTDGFESGDTSRWSSSVP